MGQFDQIREVENFRLGSISMIEAILWQIRLNSEFETLVAAVSADATALDRGIDLWTHPLWLDDTPEWAVRGWETLATELTKRAPHWKTLVRWYEDRLHGDDWAASQGRPAIPELDIARASLPDSYWKKGRQGGERSHRQVGSLFLGWHPDRRPGFARVSRTIGGRTRRRSSLN
jgi:hypothetical protein